ncbi:MAG: hypothetical protein V9F03_10865 [Microthrixaceae bacterium]
MQMSAGFAVSAVGVPRSILLGAMNADEQLNAVVIALFVLAGVIAVTTVIYWRLTRPDPLSSAQRRTAVPDSSELDQSAEPVGEAWKSDKTTP